jgi:transcriptional regulator with XRE-family HTH domain
MNPHSSPGDRTVGEMIRLARLATHQSQRQLGEHVGYSASAISRIETGRRVLDIATARTIATALGIPAAHLGLAGDSPDPPDTPDISHPAVIPATRLSTAPSKDGDDPVRRREFLGAGVAIATGLGVPGRAVATTPVPPMPSAFVRLDRVLFGRAAAPAPVDAAHLRAALATARAAFRDARYTTLGDQLPDLIALGESSRRATTATTRETICAILADTFSLTTEWCVKQNQDPLAWVTADRALRAARDSGRPATIGEAARMVAIAMRRVGHYDAATDLLTATALDLGADHGNPDADTLAAYGSLLLTASYAAAQGGHRPAALELSGEARQAVRRLGQHTVGGLFTPHFTTDQVALYRIGIHHALGDDVAAIDHAGTIDVARLPTPERRARYCLDVARTYRTLGKPDKAYQALLAAERYAPEDVRRPSVRTVVAELLYTPGSMPGLRAFAHRIGATT